MQPVALKSEVLQQLGVADSLQYYIIQCVTLMCGRDCSNGVYNIVVLTD